MLISEKLSKNAIRMFQIEQAKNVLNLVFQKKVKISFDHSVLGNYIFFYFYSNKFHVKEKNFIIYLFIY